MLKRILTICAELVIPACAAAVPLECGLPQTRVTVEGESIMMWKGGGDDGMIPFKVPSSLAIPENGTIYLEVIYLDEGYGKLDVRFFPQPQGPIAPDRFLGLSRSGSGKLAAARMRLSGIPSGTFDGATVNVRVEGEPLAIRSVSLQETPFDDGNFKYVISSPWEGPYRGPSVKPPDNSSLKGKVMAGYQGWFRTPNDPNGKGWVHWGDIRNGAFSVDMWPDVSGYPASCLERAGDVRLMSGKPAYLFSSAWPQVADTHFRWMREHDIDGAFLQRFVADGSHAINGKPEWVLANVRASANREGRIWAIEYDVSGYPDARLLETLKTDWKWLVDKFRLLEDPNYARENGQPVVFIWGMPFPDRKISQGTANAVADFFRNDPKYGGNHVIGGIPGNWRTMDAGWQDHFKKYHSVLSWMSPRYAEDLADFRKLGLGYHAHVKPGFSWANLKHLPTGDDSIAYTPREGGKRYWDEITSATRAGADRLFVGMFDECDEATAIMPMSDDPPPTPARPGVAATFYNGTRAQESGKFVPLSSAEISLGAAPPAKGIAAGEFFVRMGGRVVFPEAGSYTFSVAGAAGDDVELFLDGKSILQARNFSGSAVSKDVIDAGAGEGMPFRLDYAHRSGTGTLRLMWESAGMQKQPVPSSALVDAWGRFIDNEGRPPDW